MHAITVVPRNPPPGLQVKAREMEMTADQFETLQMYNQMRKVMPWVHVYPAHSYCTTDTIFLDAIHLLGEMCIVTLGFFVTFEVRKSSPYHATSPHMDRIVTTAITLADQSTTRRRRRQTGAVTGGVSLIGSMPLAQRLKYHSYTIG